MSKKDLNACDRCKLVDDSEHLYWHEDVDECDATKFKDGLYDALCENCFRDLGFAWCFIPTHLAKKLWKITEVFGIDYDGYEGLIEEESDLERYEIFGLESNFGDMEELRKVVKQYDTALIYLVNKQ